MQGYSEIISVGDQDMTSPTLFDKNFSKVHDPMDSGLHEKLETKVIFQHISLSLDYLDILSNVNVLPTGLSNNSIHFSKV